MNSRDEEKSYGDLQDQVETEQFLPVPFFLPVALPMLRRNNAIQM